RGVSRTYEAEPNRDAIDAGGQSGMGAAGARDRASGSAGQTDIPAAAAQMGQHDAELQFGIAADRDGFRQPDRRPRLRHVALPGERAAARYLPWPGLGGPA